MSETMCSSKSSPRPSKKKVKSSYQVWLKSKTEWEKKNMSEAMSKSNPKPCIKNNESEEKKKSETMSKLVKPETE